MTTRHDYQQQLRELNPDFKVGPVSIRPDADVDLSEDQVANFKFASCVKCEGMVKPYIVYFGENVPKSRVEFLYEKVEECDGLLVVGSSMQVRDTLQSINQSHMSTFFPPKNFLIGLLD
jgi:NAD-dependent deacetylase sirtuin 4